MSTAAHPREYPSMLIQARIDQTLLTAQETRPGVYDIFSSRMDGSRVVTRASFFATSEHTALENFFRLFRRVKQERHAPPTDCALTYRRKRRGK